MLLAGLGQSVLGNTVSSVLSTSLGQQLLCRILIKAVQFTRAFDISGTKSYTVWGVTKSLERYQVGNFRVVCNKDPFN